MDLTKELWNKLTGAAVSGYAASGGGLMISRCCPWRVEDIKNIITQSLSLASSSEQADTSWPLLEEDFS